MSSNLIVDPDIVYTTEIRKELEQALNENEELRTDNEKLRETAQRTNARMAALTEKFEELLTERDNYKQRLEEVKETHETELRNVTEEIAAAARFSDSEWREHCDRVEAACVRLQKTVNACIPAALAHLPHEEEAARCRLQDEEGQQRRDLRGRQWKASLKQVRAREAYRAEAVFTARGLSMSALRRKYLGKGPATYRNSNAAGEGLYNLFLALRPGGPVESFAMRVLLKGESNVTDVRYNRQGSNAKWLSRHYTIPAADSYKLAACVLCHLPTVKKLGFRYLPPLSTRSLEWVSHLPQCMGELYFLHTDYTAADLRELHRRRGGRTFRVWVHAKNCTDWGELDSFGDVDTKKARVNEELDGMVRWS